MQPLDFDVIIVGAGPAGTAAAFHCRSRNLKVLLIDRAPAVPDKPCAGGLTLKTLALMPYSIAPVIEHVTTGFDIGIYQSDIGDGAERRLETDPGMAPRPAQVKTFDRGSDICAFVVRSKFDDFNRDKALGAGAELKYLAKIDEIKQHGDYVELKSGGQSLRAKYLIGADGANSQVRRLAMPINGFYRGFAIEGLVPYHALSGQPNAEFLLGFAESGYGWIFPKADHANVGIYTNRSDIHLSKELLKSYGRLRLGTDEISHIKGYPLGFGGETYWQVRGRVVLVGDAGGFVEPLLGEGLHNAIKSGITAARAIANLEGVKSNGRFVEESLDLEFRRLSYPIAKDVKRCRDIAYHILYPRLGGLGGKALMHPLSRYVLLKGFAAGKTTRSLTNRFLLAPFMQPQKLRSLADYRELPRITAD